MKYALARPEHGHGYHGCPRFFTGRYVAGESLALMSPVTSGRPDQAKTWEDRLVAEVVMALLNVGVAAATGENSKPWIIMEMPEAWT
jgi:hypothetical protein